MTIEQLKKIASGEQETMGMDEVRTPSMTMTNCSFVVGFPSKREREMAAEIIRLRGMLGESGLSQ